MYNKVQACFLVETYDKLKISNFYLLMAVLHSATERLVS